MISKAKILYATVVLCNLVASSCSLCDATQGNICIGNERILRRPKRYLSYPEGSSLQLAYDQTIPMVAAQLLFTIGITVALAFELPSQPLYYITKELRENLQTLLRGEDIDVPEDAEDDGTKRKDWNVNDLEFVDTAGDPNKHNYYYNNKVKVWNKTEDGYYFYDTVNKTIPLNKTIPSLSKFLTTFVTTLGNATQIKIHKDGKIRNDTANLFLRKNHRVFPIFGKRSVDENKQYHENDVLDDEDLFYLEHHRNSRFDMYEKIEKFLSVKNRNGTACVLKSLCETSQKNQNEEKGSFLTEILRAVFSLPDQIHPHKKDNHRHYDEAHQKLDHDCSILYPDCEESFWSPDFVF